MRRWRLIVDDGAGAAEGLATDESLMQAYHGDDVPPPTLRLYSYRTHVALVGRFQDPLAELRLDECAATGTEVNRRPTGGGAIIMGEKQLGVALVTSMRDGNTPRYARAIIDTFAEGILLGLKRLGVTGELRGKNDIAVAGRKIAGLGIYVDANDAVLFHASVLAGLDVEFMLRVLNIPAAKLADKAVTSVEQRITTVSREAARPITVDALRVCVEAGFEERFGIRLDERPIDGEERAAAMELVAQKYGSDEWLRQRVADAPAGTSILKTPGGLLRVAVGLGGDAIKDVLLTGDFMAGDAGVTAVEAALKWTAADRTGVERAVGEGLRRGGGIDGVPEHDLVEAVWQAVLDARARRGATGSCYYPDHDKTKHDKTKEAVSWR